MQDIPDLLAGLKGSIAILAEFLKNIHAEKLNFRRGDDFWTIAEHASHLAQVQPMLLVRLQRFMDEDCPEFVPYIPGNGDADEKPPQMEMRAALAAFTDQRSKQLDLLRKADEAAWRKTAVHPEYEQYSLHILARHILMHDYWHMYRMEEICLTREEYLTRLE